MGSCNYRSDASVPRPFLANVIICVSVNERAWRGCQSDTLRSTVLKNCWSIQFWLCQRIIRSITREVLQMHSCFKSSRTEWPHPSSWMRDLKMWNVETDNIWLGRWVRSLLQRLQHEQLLQDLRLAGLSDLSCQKHLVHHRVDLKHNSSILSIIKK